MTRRAVITVAPSPEWTDAVVVTLACGHQHLGPAAIAPAVGLIVPCAACDEETHESPME